MRIRRAHNRQLDAAPLGCDGPTYRYQARLAGGARGCASSQDWIPGAVTPGETDNAKEESTGVATTGSAGNSASGCRLHQAQ